MLWDKIWLKYILFLKVLLPVFFPYMDILINTITFTGKYKNTYFSKLGGNYKDLAKISNNPRLPL